jgi:hypothetical protein
MIRWLNHDLNKQGIIKMGKKALFVISFISLIAGLIAIGNTTNQYHKDVDAINEHAEDCANLQNTLNQNAEEFNNLPDDNIYLKNAIITEHNLQVAKFEGMCS